jgi:hypothetical protein
MNPTKGPANAGPFVVSLAPSGRDMASKIVRNFEVFTGF